MSKRSLIEATRKKIEPILEGYGRPCRVVDMTEAPQCWRIRLRPLRQRLARDEEGERTGQFTRISHLERLADDIALGIGVPAVSFAVDHDGLWMEVPKHKVSSVKLEDIWHSELRDNMKLALGVATDGSLVEIDLDDPNSCHLLIGGSSGSGKSVLLMTILYNIIAKDGLSWDLLPEFIIIDTKHDLEKAVGNASQMHFSEAVSDSVEAVRTLEYVLRLTRSRHERLDETFAPLVVVIDEYADLMYQNKYVDALVAAIARIGRSARVHLIIATQRPSRDVITGQIKANIPARIALKVPSRYDSATIINESGAEDLVGKGDALLSFQGQTIRFQVAM